MKLIKYPSKEQWAELLKRPALNTESLFDTVRTRTSEASGFEYGELVRYSSYYYK